MTFMQFQPVRSFLVFEPILTFSLLRCWDEVYPALRLYRFGYKRRTCEAVLLALILGLDYLHKFLQH